MTLRGFLNARWIEAPQLVDTLVADAQTNLRCPKCGGSVEGSSQLMPDSVAVIHSPPGERLRYCYMDLAPWEAEEDRVLKPVVSNFHGHPDFNPVWSLT